MKFRFALITGLVGVSLMAFQGCEETGTNNGASKFSRALNQVTGRVTGGTGGTPKITAIVGSGNAKQQVRAIVDQATNRFRLDNLPVGTKSVVIEQAGKARTVKFPVNQAAQGKLSALIPETNLTAESVDLGDVSMDATGDHYVAQRNPFESVLDTDGDGKMDYFDDDIDDDGVMNFDDLDSLFGDDWSDYANWGWDDDFMLDDFDCNGNGVADWEEGYYDASCWEEAWDQFWGDDYWSSEDYYYSDDSDYGYDDGSDYGYDDGSDDYDDYGYDDYGYDDGSNSSYEDTSWDDSSDDSSYDDSGWY